MENLLFFLIKIWEIFYFWAKVKNSITFIILFFFYMYYILFVFMYHGNLQFQQLTEEKFRAVNWELSHILIKVSSGFKCHDLLHEFDNLLGFK